VNCEVRCGLSVVAPVDSGVKWNVVWVLESADDRIMLTTTPLKSQEGAVGVI